MTVDTKNDTGVCRNCDEGVWRMKGWNGEWMAWRHTGSIFQPIECIAPSNGTATPK